MLTAIFFPTNPWAAPFDLQRLAEDGIRRGMALYSNGRQYALALRPIPGWQPIDNQ